MAFFGGPGTLPPTSGMGASHSIVAVFLPSAGRNIAHTGGGSRPDLVRSRTIRSISAVCDSEPINCGSGRRARPLLRLRGTSEHGPTLLLVCWLLVRTTIIVAMQKATLNDDILREVFDYLAPHSDLDDYTDAIRTGWTDLAHAALVCHGWARPAQLALYASTVMIHLNDVPDNATCPHECAPIATLFVRTIRTCPHLRPLVRSIVLQVTIDMKRFRKKNVDWLYLLPEDGLRAFQCFWFTRHVRFPLSLLSAPAVRTARHVHLHSEYEVIPFSSVTSLKGAKDLHVHVNTPQVRTDGKFKEMIFDSLPPVQKLTLNMHDYPGHGQYLAALAPGLQSFTTTGEWFKNASLAEPAGKEIARYCRDVKELVLCIDWASLWINPFIRRLFRCPYPFLDDLVSQKTRMERLVTPPGSYTEKFFQHLPPTLKVLEFVLQSGASFAFERPLQEAIIRLRDKNLKRPMAMAKIVFWSMVECNGPNEGRAELREVCSASGVVFCHKVWDKRGVQDRMSRSVHAFLANSHLI
ncbi:hypothetical protein L227DRAFT_348031 [Lentinus tigrinus ALCF2SS1-6]|uniref:Uncharacterized protein n=1 Tax=Lentinus tigrinus ALCF2SS1-6 TaxID=1328759 RepID=A0A5C2RS37_9APHY|nr:hypothetical protein L227DRAFT_348031 [Lentinus tigrinus ALCF2SS1-6]